MIQLNLRTWNLSPGEATAVELAASVVQSALRTSSEREWNVAVAPAATSGGAPVINDEGGGGTIVLITSLHDEVHRLDIPWNQAGARLHEVFDRLAKHPQLSLLVCTQLRHIPPLDDAPPGQMVRLRRLNLLAIGFSQLFGCHIIDVDRALADIGARSLDTDFRLTGAYGPAAAARCIAMGVLAAGLDELIPYELQDAAHAVIAAQPVSLADSPDLATAHAVHAPPGNLLRIKAGRRTESAVLVYDQTDKRMGIYIRLLLSGQLGPRETWRMFVGAMRKHGLRRAIGKVLPSRARR